MGYSPIISSCCSLFACRWAHHKSVTHDQCDARPTVRPTVPTGSLLANTRLYYLVIEAHLMHRWLPKPALASTVSEFQTLNLSVKTLAWAFYVYMKTSVAQLPGVVVHIGRIKPPSAPDRMS